MKTSRARRRWLQYGVAAVVVAAVVLVLAIPQIIGSLQPKGATSTSTTKISFDESAAAAFLHVPRLYADLGYPAADYAGYPKVNYTSLGCTGQTPPSVMDLGHAVELAATALKLDPANYSFAYAQFVPGSVSSCSSAVHPLWMLSFARAYDGFWVFGPYGHGGLFPVAATVDAVNGTVLKTSTDLSSLPASGTYQLSIGSSVALAEVRESDVNVTAFGTTFPLTASGNVTSEQPGMALIGPANQDSAFHSPLNASLSGQRMLCWVVSMTATTKSYAYQGTFVVDAETGKLVSYYLSGELNP